MPARRVPKRRLLLAAPALAAPGRPSPILTTPEARDVLTYARPAIARVTHVDLGLAVDFATLTVRGAATLDLLAAHDAREIVLDDKDW